MGAPGSPAGNTDVPSPPRRGRRPPIRTREDYFMNEIRHTSLLMQWKKSPRLIRTKIERLLRHPDLTIHLKVMCHLKLAANALPRMRTYRDADYIIYHANKAIEIHKGAPPGYDYEDCSDLVSMALKIVDRCVVFEEDADDNVGIHQDCDCCAAVPGQGY